MFGPLVLSLATASPAANILLLDVYHPAVGYKSPFIANSFASAPNVGFDIKALEGYAGGPFEKKWDKLVTQKSVSQTPWEGDYWPVYKDGINYRWEGTNGLSPVEKYAKAFGLDAKSLADSVSRKSGILGQTHNKKCKTNSDCDQGTACATRRDETEGYCIPTWFGICHAWAPAAFVEKEPKCAVTKNGVTFHPMDLKALISQIYDSSSVPTVFTGRRCDIAKPKTDNDGRVVEDECRDVAPEFFHLAVTNLIGKYDKSFVADVDYNDEVWNQPIRGYQILEQRKVSLDDGAREFFPTMYPPSYPYNPAAKELLYVRMRFSYIVESTENVTGLADRYTRTRTYEYVLELDGRENIIGGEWIGGSLTDHVDFIWAPTRGPSDNAVVLGGISYKEVKKMIEASHKC